MKLESVPLFADLSQFEYEGVFMDFHNDYLFEKLIFEENKIRIFFKKISDEKKVLLVFIGVSFEQFEITSLPSEEVCIDILYRGRKQIGNNLIDRMDNKGYVYLNFVENFRMEFWAEIVELEWI